MAASPQLNALSSPNTPFSKPAMSLNTVVLASSIHLVIAPPVAAAQMGCNISHCLGTAPKGEPYVLQYLETVG